LTLSLLTLLHRSLLHRQSRALHAWIALTVSAAISTALLSLYAGLDAKLHHEFRTFGANALITVSDPHGVDAATLTAIRSTAGPGAEAVPFGYAVGSTASHEPIVLAGTDMAATRRLNSWWQVSAWPQETPQNDTEILVGSRALSQLEAKDGHASLSYGNRSQTFQIAGTVHTGGAEDSRVYLPLAAFAAFTGAPASTVEVQIPGNSAQVNAALDRIRTQLPQAAEVHPIRQLVEGETRIVDRTRSLMFGSLVLISLMVAVSVLATLSASVLERRRDFAVLKALGSSQAKLQALFLLEALALSLAGVVSGFILGAVAAIAIGKINFGAPIFPTVAILPPVAALNLVVATLAALLPLRVLRRLQPASLLKGD
jgi:putative ABC transport system permease protein